MATVDVNEVIEIFKKLSYPKKYALYQFAQFLDQSGLESDPLFQKTIEDIRLNHSRTITSSKDIEQLIAEMEAVHEL